MPCNIDVTVAAVIERNNRFLMVEELVNGIAVLNQPAGHVEHGESLLAAAIRETREETGYQFRPSELLGIYLWQQSECGRSFLRVCFTGSVIAPIDSPDLDHGIVAAHWLTCDELHSSPLPLRSPMVLQCIADYTTGAHYPLEALVHLLPEYPRAAKRA